MKSCPCTWTGLTAAATARRAEAASAVRREGMLGIGERNADEMLAQEDIQKLMYSNQQAMKQWLKAVGWKDEREMACQRRKYLMMQKK